MSLLGSLGSLAGGAIGGSLAGPLGAKVGSSVGGSGKLDLNEMIMAAKGDPALMAKIQDYIKAQGINPESLKLAGGGTAMPPDTITNGKFMSKHAPNFSEKVGPLAKTTYKSSGGEVWERAYHNPLMPKPSGGEGKK